MSGIEIVGLILGIFPLVVTMAEGCESAYGMLAAWRQFRQEFTSFSNRLRGQKVLFGQHIQMALRLIVDSEAQIDEMMKGSHGKAWESSVLANQLQLQFSGPDEFQTYCSVLCDVYRELKKMEKRFEACVNKSNAATGTSKDIDLLHGFRKLHFCFHRKRFDKQVSFIGKQIDMLDKLLGNVEVLEPARSRQSLRSLVFQGIRDQASSLHRALSRSWTCQCPDTHIFEFLLTGKKRWNTIRQHQGQMDQKLRVAFSVMQPVDISVPDGSEKDVTQLQRTLTGNHHSLCATETSMVVEFKEGSAESPSSGLENLLESGSLGSNIASDTARTLFPSKHSSVRKSSLVNTETLIDDLCHKIKIWENSDPFLGYLADGLGAYHALQVVQELVVKTKNVNGVLSLREILSGGAKTIPRPSRLSIAVMLAYAVLELHSSPWLPAAWDNRDVYFWVNDHGDVIVEHPFLVSLTSPGDASVVETNQSGDPANPLRSLGIIIMELWFNQTLESQPCWKASLGSDGKETEHTRFNAATIWQRMIFEDCGKPLHNITWRCIWGDFGMDTQDLGDKGLSLAVYENVVRKLEEFVATFEIYKFSQ